MHRLAHFHHLLFLPVCLLLLPLPLKVGCAFRRLFVLDLLKLLFGDRCDGLGADLGVFVGEFRATL